jgi:predicted transcriptional regulator
MTIPEESAATESIALRAFAVLEQVVNAPEPMSLDALTSALNLPKPTVFRILNLLNDASLLRREPASKRYTIGPRLTSFAVDLWRSDTLRLQWRRALEDAVAEIGETCNLTLLENNQVLYLDRVETSHPLRLHLEVGTRVPLHCTASGKLFLSQTSPKPNVCSAMSPISASRPRPSRASLRCRPSSQRCESPASARTTANCSTTRSQSRCQCSAETAPFSPPSLCMRHLRVRASRVVWIMSTPCGARHPPSLRRCPLAAR